MNLLIAGLAIQDPGFGGPGLEDPAFGNDSGVPWWFKLAGVAIGLFVLLMIVMVVKAVRQTKATKAYVAEHGWTYRARDRKLATRWTGPPFETGSNRRCEDVIEGRYQGWPFAAFVYRYDTGSGASSLLHPRMMDRLLQGERESWALRNGDLLDIDNWDGKPEGITRHLDHLIDILNEVPDFVWQDRGGRPELLKGVR